MNRARLRSLPTAICWRNDAQDGFGAAGIIFDTRRNQKHMQAARNLRGVSFPPFKHSEINNEDAASPFHPAGATDNDCIIQHDLACSLWVPSVLYCIHESNAHMAICDIECKPSVTEQHCRCQMRTQTKGSMLNHAFRFHLLKHFYFAHISVCMHGGPRMAAMWLSASQMNALRSPNPSILSGFLEQI